MWYLGGSLVGYLSGSPVGYLCRSPVGYLGGSPVGYFGGSLVGYLGGSLVGYFETTRDRLLAKLLQIRLQVVWNAWKSLSRATCFPIV